MVARDPRVLEDQLHELGREQRMSWRQVRRCRAALARGEMADIVVMLFGAVFTEAQLESLPRALERGADPWELLLLRVHGGTCEGEDLPRLDAIELRRRLEKVAELGEGSPSPWLLHYASLLATEARRRRGARGKRT